MQKHMLRKPRTAYSAKAFHNSAGSPRIGDAAGIQTSRDLQGSKAKAPNLLSQNGSFPLSEADGNGGR